MVQHYLNNNFGVIIIPQEDGSRLVFGDELRPLQFTAIKGDSGKTAKDPKKFDYEFKTDSFTPGYSYDGPIELDGVTIPALS